MNSKDGMWSTGCFIHLGGTYYSHFLSLRQEIINLFEGISSDLFKILNVYPLLCWEDFKFFLFGIKQIFQYFIIYLQIGDMHSGFLNPYLITFLPLEDLFTCLLQESFVIGRFALNWVGFTCSSLPIGKHCGVEPFISIRDKFKSNIWE